MAEQDHYAALRLTPRASDAEIKRRYRMLMRQVHPDANVDDPDATRKAARLNRAFETLGDPGKRRAYDAALRSAGNRATSTAASTSAWRRAEQRKYAAWAVEPDWEEVVAGHVPPKRPAHVHRPAPVIEPAEIEVDLAELRRDARIRRPITVTNPCDCTLRGDVSTSEPWVWGPIGRFEVAPRSSVTFEIEVIARKVSFPGLSRVQFVTRDWTGSVPLKITGYEPKRRRVPPLPAAMPYVRARRQKWAKYR
ncbi:MAG: J domain-containing protein [Dehalococcoidia bacterium]|nr:J domain-containing protein [Dehalococcoidia bacterium]